MIARARPLLGTYVELRCEDAAPAALRAAFAAVETVQRLMSFHDPNSELSRLNREAHRHPVAVHAWTWRVLRICAQLHRASGGLFDPAVAPQLVRAGLLPVPAGPAPADTASFADVRLLAGRRVRFAKPLWLDLGGIAKGFAVDRAVASLRACGVRQAVVNAGGDLRVIGREPAPIWLRDPREPRRLLPAGHLRNGACATSGNYFHARAGARSIVGHAANDRLSASVTVVAKRCVLADALTKVAVLATPETRQALLTRLGGQLAAAS